MTGKLKSQQTSSKLQRELQKTKEKLAKVQRSLHEAQAAFEAIQKGEIDALIIGGTQDPQVYTLKGADHTYRLFLENMNEGALTVNEEGVILFANNHFSRMVNLPLEKIIGSSLYSFIEESEHSGFMEILTSLPERHVSKKITLKVSDKTNISTFFNLNRLSLSDANVICIIITDLREREHLASRTLELSLSNEELMRSNKELESFAYVASHDLQEPLRMITSYVQLIQKGYQDKRLQGHIGEYVEHVVDAAERMRNLINALLDYSRLRSSPLKLKLQSLETPLKHAAENIQSLIVESRTSITHDPLPMALIDELQITRVFQNLLHNAIKFRSKNTPRIHISSRQQGSFIEISVKDNSIGIAPEFYAKIFDIFQRLHTRESYSGTGMGLAICKLAIERHGGRIWTKSEVGKGSTFYFTLPQYENSDSKKGVI
jgi:signal transduction histidine kinase